MLPMTSPLSRRAGARPGSADGCTCRIAAARALLALSCLLPLAGCPAGGGSVVPPLTPVRGKVTVDGQPVTSGQVSFFPIAVDKQYKYAPPSGQIDASGNYELFTEGQAGAPAGKYKVMVTPSMVPAAGAKAMPKTPFNDNYRDAKKTPLEKDVPSASYDLDLKK